MHMAIYRFVPYWPIFVILLAFFVGLAVLYLQVAIPVYRISASILIKDEKKGVEQSRMVESFDIYTSKKIVENEIEVIKSKNLLKQVVQLLNLASPISEDGAVFDRSAYASSPVVAEIRHVDPFREVDKFNIFYHEPDSTVDFDGKVCPLNIWVKTYFGEIRFVKNPNLREPASGQLYISLLDPRMVVERIGKSLTVGASNKLATVVTLSLNDEVPARGEAILNALVAAYTKANVRDKNSLALSTLEFVDERIEMIERELDSLEQIIEHYKVANGIVDLGEKGKVFLRNVADNDQKLSGLDMQLAILDNIERYLLGRDNSTVPPSTLGLEDKSITQVIQDLYSAEIEYTRLKSSTTEDNPIVIAATERIAQMRTQIRENLKNQRQSLKASRSNLALTNARYASTLEAMPQQEKYLLEATRQQSIKNDVYTLLLQKREETIMSSKAIVSDNRIVETAESSIKPIAPNKILFLAVASIMGMLCGMVWVIGKESFSRTILFRSEIESSTTIPVVGEIIDVLALPKSKINGGNGLLIAQFMQLRASLGLFGKEQKKVILVTSSVPGEGKTFVTSNLATSLARKGKKVLLLDLDLRNPSLSSLYGAGSTPGIADFFAGQITLEKCVRPTATRNLYLLPAGKRDITTADEFLDSDLDGFFRSLRSLFDIVVIDTPPTGPVADAVVFSPFADVTLFVMRHNKTPKSVLHALQAGGKIASLRKIAIVFNGVKKRGVLAGPYDYGYEHSHMYSYAESKHTAKKFGRS